MNRPNPHEIERRLSETPAPPPPPELLERLREEIPEPRELWEKRPSSPTRSKRWLIAASLLVAVGAAFLGYRMLPETDDELMAAFESPPEHEEVRTLPQSAKGVDLVERELQVEEVVTEVLERLRSQPPRDPDTAAQAAAPSVTATLESGRASVGATDDRGVDERERRVTGADTEAPRSGEKVSTATSEEPLVGERRLQASGVRADQLGQIPTAIPRSPKESFLHQSVAQEPMPRTAPRRRPVPEPIPVPGTAPPSTGGTAEPNDQPYGDVFYREYGVNPFIDTDDDPLSTFGLDVDTGSYSIVRRYLNDGNLPPREAVRIEEMINYFDYDDTPPRRGDFEIHSELAPTPFTISSGYRLLRFGIRGRVISAERRRPATLIFVVDVSGSMDRQNRLGLVKESLRLLLDQLRDDDRVGLVVYGSYGEILLDPTGDHDAIRMAIDRLQAGGSTNAEEGLVLAYELASRGFREEAINRIILCSDGVANVGRTGPESILERIRWEATRGIELTTVGFGMGNYNDVLMEQLADQGDGSYAYVDDLSEARRIFVENLTGTLQTIASDAKVQVEFDPERVSRYRLLGYENRDIDDDRFRDDTVDAGEIGAGHSVVALYEIKLEEGRPAHGTLATLRLRYLSEETHRVEEIEQPVRERDGAEGWWQASPELKLAATVAEFGELLKGSYWAREGGFGQLLPIAQEMSGELAGDREVAELVGLIARAAGLDR